MYLDIKGYCKELGNELKKQVYFHVSFLKKHFLEVNVTEMGRQIYKDAER